MSKVKTIILIVVLVVLTNGLQFFIQHMSRASLEEKLNSEIATLSATIDQLGPIQTVYSVSGSVEAGAEIKSEQITEMSLPSSMITDAYITNPEEIVGKLYKVAIEPGTPLTTNMIMDRDIEDSTRDVDICVDRWTVGLKVGDYIDYRLTLPYGDDYIVIPHLRIEMVGSTTLKVYMNETQWQLYQGSLVDYYLHSSQGATVYVTKYVEPGVQQPAQAYYTVPENVKAIMLMDPNIVDKAEATANSNMRKSINKLLKQLQGEDYNPDEETSALNSGRTQFNSNVNNDASIMQDQADSEDSSDEDNPYGEKGLFDDESTVDDGSTESSTEDTVE